MTMSRRKMIALVGGGVVLAAGASVGGFAATRRPNAALLPWHIAGQYDDPRMAALSWAILAPNPHNRQPWQAELVGTDSLRIWREGSRNLPETDPFDRQMTIGMGCFLEIFRMAAAELGFNAQTELFPEGEEGPVADITMTSGGQSDPLFDLVPMRHTNRMAYEDRLPPQEALTSLLAEASATVTRSSDVEALRTLAWQAMWVELSTHRTHMESIELTRLGKREIIANPDGISLGGTMLEGMMAVGMITREGQADPESSEYKQTADFIRTAMDATPAYVTVVTNGNTRLDQIEAGRRWVRLHLTATREGIAMQPLSQALQEYTEQADLYAQVHEMLAQPGETVQMLGRIGYAAPVGPSPRWPLENRLI
ncbi:MAG: twin-arginine translocation pathway signal protein [Pseudoruegeria sp.]